MKSKFLLIVCGICWLAGLHQVTLGQQPKLVLEPGHTSEVKRVWLSPDEKNLVSMSEDKLVFWEVRSQTILREVKNVKEFYVSPNNKTVATRDENYQSLILWSVETGALIFSIDNFYDWNFSPDGNRLISCHGNGILRVWNILEKQFLQTQIPSQKPIVNCMLSAEGLFLFGTDENNGTLYSGEITDKNNGTLFGMIIKQVSFRQREDVASWGVTPDGKFLITESRNKELVISGLSNEAVVQVPKEIFSKKDNYWELSPAGKYLIIYGKDHWESILETATGQVKYSFIKDGSRSIRVSRDDKILHAGSTFYSLEENRLLPVITEKAHEYKVSPNGKVLFFYNQSRHPLGLWNVEEGRQIFARGQKPLDLTDYLVDFSAFSPDGKLIAFREFEFGHSPGSKIRISVWNTLTGKETHLFESLVPSPPVQPYLAGIPGGIGSGDNYIPIRLRTSSKNPIEEQLTFNSKGDLLVGGDATGNIFIWDVVNLRRRSMLKAHSFALKSSFTKNGEGLTVFDTRTTYRLWDLKTGNISNRLQYYTPDDPGEEFSGHFEDEAYIVKNKKSGSVILKQENIDYAMMSPKKNLCLIAKRIGGKQRLDVWNLKTNRIVFTDEEVAYMSGTFSPDEKYFLIERDSPRDQIELWDIEKHKIVMTQKDVGLTTRFSKNSRYLRFTRKINNTSQIELWDVKNNKTKLTIPYEGQDISSSGIIESGFSSDEKYFAVGNPRDRFTSRGKVITEYSLGLWNIESGEKFLSADNITYHQFNDDMTNLLVEFTDRIKWWDFKNNIIRETMFPSKNFISQNLAWHQSRPSSGNKHWVFWQRKSGNESSDVILWNSIKSRIFTLSDHSSLITSADFSLDERYLLTSGEDGTMKIWSTDNGQLLITLVLLDDADWLVTTPEGFFDGTANAWKKLLWRLDENTNSAVEIYFNEFFYPNLLQDVLAGKAPKPKADQELNKLDRRQPSVEIVSINGHAPSKFDTEDGGTSSVDKRTVIVTIEVTNNIDKKIQPNHQESSGAQDLRLFRNGSLVKVWHDGVFKLGKADGCEQIGPTKPNEPSRVRCQVEIPIVAGENHFAAYAFNTNNVKSNDATASIKGGDTLKRGGTLYVLAIGVNKYVNPNYNLQFAVPDVVDISRALEQEQNKLVQDVKLKQYVKTEFITLTDENATKDNILLALRLFAIGNKASLPVEAPEKLKTELWKIKPTQPEDALIIYFAGHGTSREQRFYLLPHNFTGAGESSLIEQGISDIELNQALENVDAGRLLMVIDACQSGQALGASNEGRAPMNSKGLAQLAYDKGMSILTAAQSQQAALEAVQINGKIIRHGLLTYALLQGLATVLADKDGNQQLWEREWLDFATEQVPLLQLTAMKQRHAKVKRTGRDTELYYWAGNDKNAAPENRAVQRPRVFYRRELEITPMILAKPRAKL